MVLHHLENSTGLVLWAKTGIRPTCQQGSRKMGMVGTCFQPIWDFGSHFWLASWNSFKNKFTPAKMRNGGSHPNWSKSPKKVHKNHGIRDYYKYLFFFHNFRNRTWQPVLARSQPILDFLEPCLSPCTGQYNWLSYTVLYFYLIFIFLYQWLQRFFVFLCTALQQVKHKKHVL